MKHEKQIGGFCYCQKSDCHKLYEASVGLELSKEKPLADDVPILPCGHPLEAIVFSADCVREDARFAREMDTLGMTIEKAKYLKFTEDDLK